MQGVHRARNGILEVDVPFCATHFFESRKPEGEPEPGYEWSPLRDGQGRAYFWFQLRTAGAKRKAKYLNRLGDLPTESERSEIRRALGEDVLSRTLRRLG